MNSTSPQDNSVLTQLLLLGSIVLGGWLFYLLSPILMPFFVAALLAYLGDPLADKLESLKFSRTWSVVVVFSVIFFVLTVVLLVLIPMLTDQIVKLISNIPDYLLRLKTVVEQAKQMTGIQTELLNVETLKTTLTNYGAQFGHVANNVLEYMASSGLAILQWLANLILIPVLTFYLLRDWDVMVTRIRELLPRRYADKVIEMSLECDEMLAGFIRGQLMVMTALAAIYTIGLMIIGLELSLLLGVVAGIVSFVPYLGLIVGIALSGLAAYLQFSELLPILYVAVVFGVAQMIEGMVLTPRFVGERIGLHPVAVLFAVMAGGQLFGFTGILLALPVAAVVMVLLRHAHSKYVNSNLYS